jgi:hypothetical protein
VACLSGAIAVDAASLSSPAANPANIIAEYLAQERVCLLRLPKATRRALQLCCHGVAAVTEGPAHVQAGNVADLPEKNLLTLKITQPPTHEPELDSFAQVWQMASLDVN